MESDAKNPNQAIGLDDEQRQEEESRQARMYDCTFCKRGFSNAQALGGHMNIHRKDKAKLHQTPANSNQIPIIDERSSNVYSWPSINRGAVDKQGSHQVSSTNKGDPVEEFKKIPFFVDKQYLSGDQNQNPSPSVDVVSSTDQGLLLSSELDLELRLGPADPPPPDSPKGTKKFF
jgi:hypothetical protein